MSTIFGDSDFHPSGRRSVVTDGHQSNSWARLKERWRLWDERRHQRAALRDIADDLHLLADLGITRDEALDQAGKPFWR